MTFGSSASTNRLEIGLGTVTFGLTAGQTYTVNGTDGFSLGSIGGQTANLTLGGGSFLLNGAHGTSSGIGGIAGATGNLIVTGAGTTFQAAQSFSVGGAGTGSVTVQNGATATFNEATTFGGAATGNGSLVVTGAGSNANFLNGTVRIGSVGNGSLTINNGGSVTIAQRLEIAYFSPPGATGSVTIGGSGTGTLSCGGLSIGSTPGTLTVNAGSTINVGSQTLITDGATINMNGTWNQTAGAIQMFGGVLNLTGGSLNATGLFSTILSGGQINISGGIHNFFILARIFEAQLNHGDGTVTVNNRFDNGTGNHVINGFTTSSNPVLRLDGAVTTNLAAFFAGVDRRGTVSVVNGGRLNVNSLTLGFTSGGNGTVTVDAASVVQPTAGNTVIGLGGAGTLALNGGSFKSDGQNVFVAANPTGSGTIDVNGGSFSTMNSSGGGGQLQVGVRGPGTVLIRNGATATTNSSFLGVQANGTGTVVVSGAGSNWTNLELVVGNIGSGTMTVEAGGVVTSDLAGYVGYIGSDARGVVNLNGGTWNAGSGFSIGDRFFLGGFGVIHVNPGGNLSTPTGDIELYTGGLLNIAGGTVTANTVSNFGGQVIFSSGALIVNSGLSVDNAVFGTGLSFGAFHSLTVADVLTIPAGQTLAVNGGTLRSGSIVANGTLALNSGTFELTGSSLTIGSGGLLGSQLNVGPGLSVRVTPVNGQNITVAADGVLNLTGGTVQGNVVSSGEINLLNPTSTLGAAGRSLTNTGRLAGAGQVNSDLTNDANGRVIVDAGQRLRFSGTTNNNNANGTIEMTGGTVEFTGTLNNNTGAQISGRGTFRGSSANTSGVGLNNTGSVAFSAGVSDVFGKVQNTGMGNILTVGAGTTTFHDDVVHNGAEIRTTSGARTVFLGTVSGSGPFTGTGVVEFDGDLRPGNSPGSIEFAGDVVFGHSATLHAEIGGGVPGSGYDQLNVAGGVAFDGTFQLTLLNGFVPTFGQRFDIVNFGSRQGVFSAYAGLSLPNGLNFVPGYDGQSFYLTAVPEPTSLVLTGVVTGSALVWRQRSKRRVAPVSGIDYDAV